MDAQDDLQNVATRLQAIEEKLNKKSSDENFLKTAQAVLSFVLGLTALLTASGFLIVNSFISRFTSIHGYTVIPAQYLAAAIWLLIYITLICLAALSIGFIRFYSQYIRRRRRLCKRIPYKAVDMETGIKGIAYGLGKLRKELREFAQIRAAVVLLLSIILLLGSVGYGATTYQAIPRYLGGGKPVRLFIIFNDATDLKKLGFASLPDHGDMTITTYLLAELNDGLLVYDTTGNYAAIVKTDLIKGILDEAGAHWIVEGEAKPSDYVGLDIATPEVTPTATEGVTAEAAP